LKKGRKPESFILKPEFEGGNKALTEFIQHNLKYPQEAVSNKIEGVVRLRIDIDRNGKVLKTHVISGIGFGCDEEAERISKLLKFKTNPPKGGHITYHKDLNIPFKLPKGGFNYQIKPKKKQEESKEIPQKITYNYTINL
jgi:protein TonB